MVCHGIPLCGGVPREGSCRTGMTRRRREPRIQRTRLPRVTPGLGHLADRPESEQRQSTRQARRGLPAAGHRIE
ncbi:Eukaryotic translation initiation factor 4B [Actinacidiphila cocklensis]|uniref:Eukaryotic translation initiation factor 4B n=1 Tax=Actinacidiphila cocklensis TaxID=887465 RepID=A0A9W4DKY0_9ACTN|nr:Eukaryotic translation initiation factor 4B [Actinacidiphila cocklensis]